MYRFLIIFAVLALTGIALINWNGAEPAIQSFCLLLAQISYGLIHWLDSAILLQDAILTHQPTGFALLVAESCSALSLMIFFAAAVLAYPSSWQQKAWGLGIGLLLIQVANLLRLISLLYIGAWTERATFDFIHEQAWALVLHLFILLLFGLWLNWIHQNQQDSAVGTPNAA